MVHDEDAEKPRHAITFSFIDKGNATKEGYCGKPIMIHPEKTTAWGLVVRGPSTLSYDPARRPDKAWLQLDAGVEFEAMSGPVCQKIRFPRCYCVIIQRNQAKKCRDAPVLTLHEYAKPRKPTWKRYGTKLGKSKYARKIEFPGDTWILFTRGPAYIGSSAGQGAYLWIESQLAPTLHDQC